MPETEAQRAAREARVTLAEEIAYDLIGGCASLAMVAERHGADVGPDLEESILLRAFQCDACGWWHSVEELNNLTERELCDDCHAEEDLLKEAEAETPTRTPDETRNAPPARRLDCHGPDIGKDPTWIC